jgi:hypothetical protein
MIDAHIIMLIPLATFWITLVQPIKSSIERPIITVS